MTTIPYEVLTLYKEQFHIAGCYDVELTQYPDYGTNLVRLMARKMVAYLENDGPPLEVPATWLDHWLITAAPKWVRKRWPPKMKTYQARAYFPSYRIPREGFEHKIFMWKSSVN